MATTTTPPSNDVTLVDFSSKIDREDSELVEDLYKISKKNPKLIKSSEYQAPADSSIFLRSWKMNEFKYYDVPSPFPILARGLFTQDIKKPNGKGHDYRIVVRGYDKFFNIGEVPWTTWAALEEHTSAPYTLTLKSNGCIIFIAALTPDKLVITSKHSLGVVKGSDTESHAMVGERWLNTHLQSVGKTQTDLAAFLWEKNWTAIAELCDDSFEEHVLPYSSDKTGLHLHGLNECSKQFKTMLPDVVDAFAKDWGFIVTASTVLNTIPEVKDFTEEIGKARKWNGEALEGFVVRTHVSGKPPKKGGHYTPYASGSSFFFKVKFDEPYMMYRDWREVTKSLLTKGPSMSNVAKAKLRRTETKWYVNWVIDEIKRDKSQFSEFNKGRGIIATRERFLKWMETQEGKDKVKELGQASSSIRKTEGGPSFGKTIIVPVAIPGVGKTSIAVALQYLFGFGHTQSDDIKARKPAPIFIQNVVKELKKHDVVIADKNNHLRQHRRQLREIGKKFPNPIRLMALNWSFDIPTSTIHRLCSDRVHNRGANHQTLVADQSRSYEDVLWMFLKTSEPLTDDEVDVSVEMDVEEDLPDALKRAVDACVEVLGVERPSAEKMGEALAATRGYTPQTKSQGSEKKLPEPRYYALMPELDVIEVVEKLMEGDDASVVPEGGREFWKGLVVKKRLFDRVSHVTLVHVKGLEGENRDVWDRCRAINTLPSPPLFSFKLDRLLWDDRVMALVVSDPKAIVADGEDGELSEESVQALELVSTLPKDIQTCLHITIGTADQEIAPYEARVLVNRWRDGETAGIGEVELKDLWVKGRVKGLFK